jgi:uncharacterized DUF497 family protein
VPLPGRGTADSPPRPLKITFCSKNRTLIAIATKTRNGVDIRQTLALIFGMKYFNWSHEKNELLRAERGISFEEIVLLIESGYILGIEENPARTNQRIYILEIENYAFVVPFVENQNEIFLKTAFPSRKYTKRFGLKGEI